MIHHRKLADSFRYAFAGLWLAISENQNLRIHFVAACIVAILGVVFRIDSFELGILGLTILLVIAAEMVNTSIEEVVDLVTSEHRQDAKRAKDVAAGMVLVTATGAIIIGLLIFIPHIFAVFR